MNEQTIPTKKWLILAIDDDSKILQLLENLLPEKGFNIITENNGKKALKSVLSNKPDLILLDVLMPGMDGYTVCKKLKIHPDLKDLPIIFLTSKTQTEDIVKGFESGGVDYVTKPFNISELLARVNTHLELKNSKDTILKQNDELARLNSDLTRLNEELKQKNKELEELIEKKNEFLGMAAHDLRTPLAAIIMRTELMQLQIENDKFNLVKGKGDLDKIIGMAQRMTRLISDLLSYSAIEIGKVKLDLKKEKFIPILEEHVEFFKRIANEKNIHLDIHKNEKINDIDVIIDKFRIIQVIENLLSNAIKYTFGGGKVVVSYEVKEMKFITHIKDTGQGLNSSDLNYIFKSFRKLSAKPTGGEPSTGLGLAIVKKIIDLHGGEIWVKSEKGKGSTFSFSLPLEKSCLDK
jgi:signal transduction histidine kinase